LRELLGRPLPVEQLADLFEQVAGALAAAHAAGVVHRDIKPANLMVREDDYAKVLDFGLARRLPASLGPDPARPITDPGTVFGQPQYVSPQPSRGKELDGATDVFSLGIVLYELATGRHPFAAGSLFGVLHAIQSQAAVPAARLRPDIPVALDTLLQKMLH